MNHLFFLLIAAIAILLCIMIYFLFINPPKKRPFKSADAALRDAKISEEEKKEDDKKQALRHLRKLIDQSEEELIPENRYLVKIFVEKDFPELPAILQLEDIKISIKRDHSNQSIFKVHNAIYALNIARCGYYRSARCIPSRSELEYILAHKDIINIYFKNLGLEQISDKDSFWYIDVPKEYNFNWRNFDWSIGGAYDKLYDKFKILTPTGSVNEPTGEDAKLIVLLNGWDELFEKV